MTEKQPTIPFYSQKLSKIEVDLNTDFTKGLTGVEAEKRLQAYGPNSLPEVAKDPWWKKFLSQFQDFLIYILIAGLIFSFLAGEYIDGLVILIIVLGNAILAFIQEGKAEKDLEEIQKISAPYCTVRRGGKTEKIPVSQVVVGDILLLETGDQVAADARLISLVKMQVDESSLTGESEFVKKQTDPVGEEMNLADRTNMVFKHSLVRYGRGEAVVTAIGVETEIGKIAEKLMATEKMPTPLERQLEHLGKRLGVAALVICALIFFLNWGWRGNPLVHSIIDSVSLAIAVVPEGLPAIVTICLAIGVQVMRRKNAIVKHLPAIETLGSTDFICTDKTGTITEGEMRAVAAYFDGKSHNFRDIENKKVNQSLSRLLEIALSCNNATDGSGSPTEVALLEIATKFGIVRVAKVDENPFDSARKAMSTIHKTGKKYISMVKGSPEAILASSTHILEHGKHSAMTTEKLKKLHTDLSEISRKGLRVLAFAYKDSLTSIPKSTKSAESDLTFVGFIGLKDPIRKEAREAIAQLKATGITPVMITGDQHETAFIIAKEAGILDADDELDTSVVHGQQLQGMTDAQLQNICEKVKVYARVEPNDKLRIVQALQSKKHIVAMSGDGINDSPAIKAADIGLAMGIRGTEVTKSVADVVLVDDNYLTIAAAVANSRVILRNIKFFTSYLLSCNAAEILIVLFAVLSGLPMPLNARLLLWLNVVSDFLPALAMSYEPFSSAVMKRGPNPAGAPVIDRRMWIHISVQTLVSSVLVFLTYVYYDHFSHEMGMTAAFVVLAMAEVFRALTARSHIFSLFQIGAFKNKVSNLAVVVSSALVLSLVYIPFMRHIFDTVYLDFSVLRNLLLIALVMPVVEELTKWFIRANKIQPY
ncbi:MAG: ATPase [Patescibacteria group bacterium]|nr:MAG: ATPase [Patescibacteria group bacterium]